MMHEADPSRPEAPRPIGLLIHAIGDIAVAYGLEKEKSQPYIESIVADAIIAADDIEQSRRQVMQNVNAGFDSVVDRYSCLDDRLNGIGRVLDLDHEELDIFKSLVVTETRRLIDEMSDSKGASSGPDDEPSRFDLDESEDEFEKLAHVRFNVDAQTDYLRRLGNHELLDAEEEVALSKAIEAGVLAEERLEQYATELTSFEKRELIVLVREGARAKEKMFMSNIRLVVSWSRKYSHRGMSQLDVIQEGNIGLLRAIEKFDYTLGYRFSTYAAWWIRQSMTRAIHEKASLIRLPIGLRERINAVAAERAKVEAQIGRAVTDDELSKALDMSVAQIRKLKTYANVPLSLNAPVGEDSVTELGEMLPADQNDPSRSVLGEQLNDDVTTALNGLDERSAEILRLRLGIGHDGPRTLEEVADILGVTRVDVRKIESRAIRALKEDESIRILLEGQR